jgi:hypothetical protein
VNRGAELKRIGQGKVPVEEVGSGEVVESIRVFCLEETEKLISECVINPIGGQSPSVKGCTPRLCLPCTLQIVLVPVRDLTRMERGGLAKVNLAKQGQASRQLLAEESWCWKYIFFEMTEERTSQNVPRYQIK